MDDVRVVGADRFLVDAPRLGWGHCANNHDLDLESDLVEVFIEGPEDVDPIVLERLLLWVPHFVGVRTGG